MRPHGTAVGLERNRRARAGQRRDPAVQLNRRSRCRRGGRWRRCRRCGRRRCRRRRRRSRRRWRHSRQLTHRHALIRYYHVRGSSGAGVFREHDAHDALASTARRYGSDPGCGRNRRPIAQRVRAHDDLPLSANGRRRLGRRRDLVSARRRLLRQLDTRRPDTHRATSRDRVAVRVDAICDRTIALPFARGREGDPRCCARCRPRALACDGDVQRAGPPGRSVRRGGRGYGYLTARRIGRGDVCRRRHGAAASGSDYSKGQRKIQ